MTQGSKAPSICWPFITFPSKITDKKPKTMMQRMAEDLLKERERKGENWKDKEYGPKHLIQGKMWCWHRGMRRKRWKWVGKIKFGRGCKLTCSHTLAAICSTCLCCVCVVCLLGKNNWLGVKGEPGLQNLCHYLLLPLWPTDPQISNTTNVCMYEYVSISLLEVVKDVGFFFFFFLDSGLKGWAKLSR